MILHLAKNTSAPCPSRHHRFRIKVRPAKPLGFGLCDGQAIEALSTP